MPDDPMEIGPQEYRGLDLGEGQPVPRYEPKPVDVPTSGIVWDRPTIFVEFWWNLETTVARAVKYTKISYGILQFALAIIKASQQFKESNMNLLDNWRTTMVGVIGAIAYLVKLFFGIEVSADVQLGFVTVIVFFVSLFATDAKNKQNPS